MIRHVASQTLADYVGHYALTHPLDRESLRQYEIVVRLLDRWAGHPVRLDELDTQLVSSWLAEYGQTVKPSTARSKRQMVLSLWRSAVDDGLVDPVSLMRRVRRVRVPHQAPVAWTRDEIERLLVACRSLPRWHRCGLRRAEWWALAIRVAYDSGLRWEDQVRRLRVDQVTEDGVVAWDQHKTGRFTVFQLSEATMTALRASLVRRPRELVTPWLGSHETFSDQVRTLVRRAGVRPGTWKWVRRTSATDVEIQEPGAAPRHLGHAPGSKVAYASYVDPAQVAAARRGVSPRPLSVPPGDRQAAG
jgi:integrase